MKRILSISNYIRIMLNDEIYMQRCIELARLGKGNVAPNPMVGAVIVLNDRIIGEGFHQKYGEGHAEVNAVNSVSNFSVLKEATIYVSLEPCAHFGKTPPCSDLLIKHQFKKVVIGCIDSFSKVSGQGIKKMRSAGIEVVVGVLEKECRELNKRFFTFHENKRPYIVLKWAQTKDGFIDKIRGLEKGINWISSPTTKVLVHKWRSEEQAILVGKNTVESDDPSLTVREISGNNPIRIILDSGLKLSKNYNVFNTEAPTIVLNLLKDQQVKNTTLVKLNSLEIESILNKLYQIGIQSVFIEGGAKVLNSFIAAGLWDEARVIIGNTYFENGIQAPVISKVPSLSFTFSDDIINIYSNL